MERERGLRKEREGGREREEFTFSAGGGKREGSEKRERGREGGREGGRERSLHSLLEVEREEIELCMGLYQSYNTQLLQSWNCSG